MATRTIVKPSSGPSTQSERTTPLKRPNNNNLVNSTVARPANQASSINTTARTTPIVARRIPSASQPRPLPPTTTTPRQAKDAPKAKADENQINQRGGITTTKLAGMSKLGVAGSQTTVKKPTRVLSSSATQGESIAGHVDPAFAES